jgi:hypothetical protein
MVSNDLNGHRMQFLLVVVAALPILFAGCQDRASQPMTSAPQKIASATTASARTPPATEQGNESEGMRDLRNQLYQLRVENQKLTNLVVTLKKKKEEEEKSSGGPATETTQKEFAKAQVDSKDKLKELGDKFDKFLEAMKTAGMTPQTGLTEAQLQEIVKAVQRQETVAPADSQESKSQSSNDEAQKTFKMIAAAVGAAICAAEPELCPFIAAILGELNLFGSTEERKTFLDGVQNFAEGKPLTDPQTAVVTKAAEHYKDFGEGAKMLLEKMGTTNPAVKKASEDGKKALTDQLGIPIETYQNLIKALRSNDARDVKLAKIQAVFSGGFPNEIVRKLIAKTARELGGAALGDEVSQLPVK